MIRIEYYLVNCQFAEMFHFVVIDNVQIQRARLPLAHEADEFQVAQFYSDSNFEGQISQRFLLIHIFPALL